MRGFAPIALAVAIAGILVLSLRSLHRERDHLLQQFASSQSAVARDVASDLEDRLKDVMDDGQLVTRLAEEAWRSWSDDINREQALRSAFIALATVVRHYRGLVMFGADGATIVSAIDPAETAEGRRALLAASREVMNRRDSAAESARLAGHAVMPDARAIYLYVIPIGRRVVVIAVDGKRLLQGLMRGHADSRLVIDDPLGTLWGDCAKSSGCRRLASDARAERLRALADGALASAGGQWPGDSEAAALELPPGAFATAAERVVTAGSGAWTILVATTASAIHDREKKLVVQLMATTAGILVAVGVIGLIIVRQQRRAVALTERLRHAEKVKALEDQLIRAEKLATTGMLAAGIAHEIGTPLGIIRGRAELLLEQAGAGAASGGLHAIIQQIDRIAGTIRQVLDFSRAQPVDPRPLALPAILTETLNLLSHRFRQQNLNVGVEVAPDLPPIAADPDQLQQVLINVLLNACDASKPGGELQISLRPSATTPGTLDIEIRDKGCGIPAESLHAVFDPFFTTKKRGEGTGLGLSVVASIVRNHGGQISLESVPAEGTLVRIAWPFAQGAAVNA